MESYIIDVEQKDFVLTIVVQRKLERVLDGVKHNWEYEWRGELLADDVLYHVLEDELDSPFLLKVLCSDHVHFILLYDEEVLQSETKKASS